MNNSMIYDLVVVGFGKAGKTLAGSIASKGYKVAVIEKDDKMYGGTCINVGCLPTKSLVHRAKFMEMSERIGYNNIDKQKFFADAVDEKERMTTMLRGKNYSKLSENENIDVFDAIGSFVDTNHIRLSYNNGIQEIIEGKVIVINTGSKSRNLPLADFDEKKHIHDSKSILSIKELPKHIGIIGAGYIGLEFASYFKSFGSRVTVFQNDDRFLPREDVDDATAVRQRLEKMGVEFIFNADVKNIEELKENTDGYNISLSYTQKENSEIKSVDLSEVLIAVGRIPSTDGLDLDNIGIEIGKYGEIVVDDGLRTIHDNIFAVGDVKGAQQFTFISLDDYRIILPQVLSILEGKGNVLADELHNKNVRPVFPNTTFIDPPYSRIGLSENEARKKYSNIKVKKMMAAAVPKAQVVQETDGFLKVIIDADTDLIVGAVLFCHESHEMINLFNLAINEKITASRLSSLIYNHPVMSEALNELLA